MASGRHDRVLGRIDNQVKVRGFRIELGEIEAKISQAENVTESAAVIRKNKADENEICAYFTADRDLSPEDLRKTLSESLPEYMIPAHFIQMNQFPLTANGKIDKKRCLSLRLKPFKKNTKRRKRKRSRNSRTFGKAFSV